MSAPMSLVLAAIRFDSTKVLRVAISGSAEDLAFGVAAATDYYVSGDGEPDDLCRILKECIETHSAGPSATVTIDSSWTISVSVASGTVQILWGHANTTLDREVLGFVGSTSAASSVTGDFTPDGIWRPRRMIAVDSLDRRGVVGGIAASVSGKIRVSQISEPSAERDVSFEVLIKERVRSDYLVSSEPFNFFQHQWERSIRKGYPMRIYEDEDVRTRLSYRAYRIASLDDPMSRSAAWNHLWDTRLRLRRDADLDWVATQSLDVSTGNYLSSSSTMSGQAAVTWSWWWRQDSSWASGDAAFGEWSTNQHCYQARSLSSGSGRFWVAGSLTDTGTIYVTTPTSQFGADTWYHCVVVYDAGTVTWYIDGSPVTLTVTGTVPPALLTHTSDLHIGAAGGSSLFDNGNLSQLAIWQRVLTPAEVALLRRSGPRAVDDLYAYWAMDGTARDYSDSLLDADDVGTPVYAAVAP